jgi:hypothetical protein
MKRIQKDPRFIAEIPRIYERRRRKGLLESEMGPRCLLLVLR